MKGPDAPPSLLRLEDLQVQPERVLRHPVEAGGLALAQLVALEDARLDGGLEPPVLVPDVGVDLVLRRRVRVLDRKL